MCSSEACNIWNNYIACASLIKCANAGILNSIIWGGGENKVPFVLQEMPIFDYKAIAMGMGVGVGLVDGGKHV